MSVGILRRGTFWAALPAILLTALVGTELVLVHKALSDPSVVVEDGYYSKALSWDARRAREEESARLGYRAGVALERAGPGDADVVVTLLDRQGAPVRGAAVDVSAFAIARSNHVLRGTLREAADGTYRGRMPLDRTGRWELSLRAVRGTDHFMTVLRQDLLGGARP